MKKIAIFVAAAAALVLQTPAFAESAEAAATTTDKTQKERLAKILADPSRAEDKKRDKYRHPAETFEFFQLQPGHVIGEYAPGGEWVSRILGRYVDEKGKYTGLYFGTASAF